ncbi:hypothetical protein W02_16500 [Nitrospira sp. KM1]|uniref:response regulator n=1 Tax=Nitrospira sp. KM1 TaxID=1936990 RepID=UPI0013A71282|nr:response regulator [Nitrospira sp. KM1]BCA54510.1 hypothetical protein W02_16500 [Nitrospira sp. KM1]
MSSQVRVTTYSESIRVLIIDPYESDRLYWHRQLTQFSGSYRVMEAESGGIGLQRLKDHEFDCILLELDLPDMTALEVLTHISAHLEGHLGVVVFTRHMFLSLADLALRTGAQLSLFKLVTSIEDVDRAIRMAMRPRVEESI